MINNPESQQNNLSNHAYLFRKINKLIIHMNNMNEEEAQIIKNLDGEVIEPGKEESGQKVQAEPKEQQPKPAGGI